MSITTPTKRKRFGTLMGISYVSIRHHRQSLSRFELPPPQCARVVSPQTLAAARQVEGAAKGHTRRHTSL